LCLAVLFENVGVVFLELGYGLCFLGCRASTDQGNEAMPQRV
jgi:hypothetical protein